jgi:hypothetical protein
VTVADKIHTPVGFKSSGPKFENNIRVQFQSIYLKILINYKRKNGKKKKKKKSP